MSTISYDGIKRLADIAGSALGLAITAPIQLTVAALVRLDVGSPVLFRQERPGQHARIFTLVKFRTMRQPAPGEGLESDGDRVTKLGHFLRATSLDELPSLWNVLRGDMSFIGPRPLLPDYLPRYSERQATRHQVKPGITGLAQSQGRNQLSWPERLELDAQYVQNRSVGLDIKILINTAITVIRRDGISHPDHATMVEFTGTPPSNLQDMQ